MGLKKSAMKAASYAAAPKLTFMTKHPKTTMFAKAGAWAGNAMKNKMVPSRFRPEPKNESIGTAAKGIGAAAVAAPLGWWLGRKMKGRDRMGGQTT